MFGLAERAASISKASAEMDTIISERVKSAKAALEHWEGPHAGTFVEQANAVLSKLASLKLALWGASARLSSFPTPFSASVGTARYYDGVYAAAQVAPVRPTGLASAGAKPDKLRDYVTVASGQDQRFASLAATVTLDGVTATVTSPPTPNAGEETQPVRPSELISLPDATSLVPPLMGDSATVNEFTTRVTTAFENTDRRLLDQLAKYPTLDQTWSIFTDLPLGDLDAVADRLRRASAMVDDPAAPLSQEERAALRAAIANARARLESYISLTSQGEGRNAALGGLAITGGALLADDATGVGVADDVLLPFIGLAALGAYLFTKPAPSGAELQQAWDELNRDLGTINGGLVMAVQGERLAGQARNVARHLARLLVLSEVAGVPSGEPPKHNNDDDRHWWTEIKASLRQIQQATKGASRKQAQSALLEQGWTEAQIAETEAKLAQAARLMGEDVPPFLPP